MSQQNEVPSRATIGHAVTGLLMGLADSLPGFSGGTVLYLAGRTGRLSAVLAAIGPRLRQGVAVLDLPFMLPLVLGIGTGLFVGAQGVVWLVDHRPAHLAAFLFGVILAVAPRPGPSARERSLYTLAALLIGGLLWGARVAVDASAPALLVGGMVAAAAMLLPGISGGLLLLMVGLYEPAIRGVADLDAGVLVPLGLGAAVGLLGIARLLRRLLARRPQETTAVLSGMVVASLVVLWPWRSEVGFATGTPAPPTADASAILWMLVAGAALGWWGRQAAKKTP